MNTFSWQKIGRGLEAKSTGVPPGSYAAAVFNQHSISWCGCCYIVATVQSIEDRGFIMARRRNPRAVRAVLDMQLILDHFDEMSSDIPGWNACHGGFADDVIQCMARGTCPMRTRQVDKWRGFQRRHVVTPLGDAPFKVTGYVDVPERDVEAHLLRDGPIVLEVSGVAVKSVDVHGVVVDRSVVDPDHAVSVIGWTRRQGRDCWIARNSWGGKRVPHEVPDDYLTCVGVGYNECNVSWDYWVGDPNMPGIFYLPRDLPTLHKTDPSPWIVPQIT